MEKTKKKNNTFLEDLIVTIKFALLSNILLSIGWFFNVERFLLQIKNKDEFIKTKVLVDSLHYGFSSEPKGSATEEVDIYYNNFKNKISLTDDENYLFKPRNEKSNLVKLSECYRSHNDSIYVWHHPTLKDVYAEEHQTSFEKTFDWYHISLSIILLLLGGNNIFVFINKRVDNTQVF